MSIQSEHRPFPGIPILVVMITTLIYGSLIFFMGLKSRREIRSQIINRDAEVLYSLTLMEFNRAEEEALANPWLMDIGTDLLTVVLKTSEMKSVIAVRIFNHEGQFIDALPLEFLKGELDGDEILKARQLQPFSEYHPGVRLSNYFVNPFGMEDDSSFPLLEVILPLHKADSEEILGIAQYLIDGTSIETDFAALDRNFYIQAGIAFGSGILIIALILILSFRRLQRYSELLEDRSERLLDANHELALAAKSSAIGAVTSHLIHGLKNPLSGLQDFVKGRDGERRQDSDEDWQTAAESARRMQIMIQEITSVLQEQETAQNYDFTLQEIRDIVVSKVESLAEKSGITFDAGETPVSNLDSRRGNLLLLVLMNLIQNAIEATPSGNKVALEFHPSDNRVAIHVIDEGPGLPTSIQDNLFSPCQSSKENGSGIGLAISYQLAKHIDAEIILHKTGPDGTCFIVSIAISTAAEENKKNIS